MTNIDFLVACGEVLIEPSLALETMEIREALSNRDDAKVYELLRTMF